MRWGGIILGLTITSTQVAVGSAQAQSEERHGNASCEQLWTSRNSIFARKGYCFTSPQAQAVFGKGCYPPYGQLTETEQSEVDLIKRHERSKRCVEGTASSTSASPPVHQTILIDVPIVIGGNIEIDACSGSGEVVGLNPRGDGFLSVQSGPGGKPFKEIDRLFNGGKVYICQQQGSWYGVVFTPANNSAMDCGVSSPWATRQAYTGPCRYGWVHSRYVKADAG